MIVNWQRLLLAVALQGGMSGTPEADVRPPPMELTQQEQDWIVNNPVLRVGVFKDLLPFEYISHEQMRGLSAKYLQLITERTGLNFKAVVTTTRNARSDMLLSGEVDILSARRRSKDSVDSRGMLYTTPYNTSSTILVSRFDDQPFADLEHLAGKRVVMLARETYSSSLSKMAPSMTVISAHSAEEMMTMVKGGGVDAAIASEWLLIPYLTRQYQGVLQISGVVPELNEGVSMAVRDTDVILYSILEKALASVTTHERKAIYEAWLADLDLDIPTIKAIADHYEGELWLLLAVVLLLITLVWQSWVQRRDAMSREQGKAMFLAVMSHEVRSPMNAVLAAVELLEHSALDEQQRHFTGLANRGSNALLRVVDDVLDISKMEAGQFTLNPEPTDLWDLTQQVVDDHRRYTKDKGLGLKLTGERLSTPMLLDKRRLAQVLRNLISNAIEFTDSGQVELQLQMLEGERDDCRRVLIRVIDSGVGMSRQALDSLFRPYARAKHSYKRTGGAGLGLVICRRLVRLMHGEMKLTSTLGVGTQVDVILPVKWASLSSSPSLCGVALASAVGNGVQVLVVEGSSASRKELVEQLHGLGCRVMQATDAGQGVAIFSAQRVDMVLMSCDLPDANGYGLAEAFRKLEQEQRRSYCPIVGVSALTDKDQLERCLDAGMDGLLNQPVRVVKLQQIIELWCDASLIPQLQPSVGHNPDEQDEYTELCKNLSNLIVAIALRERSQALQALQQLRVAARDVGWTNIAIPLEVIEPLLSAEGKWPATAIADHVSVLLKQWSDLHCGVKTN